MAQKHTVRVSRRIPPARIPRPEPAQARGPRLVRTAQLSPTTRVVRTRPSPLLSLLKSRSRPSTEPLAPRAPLYSRLPSPVGRDSRIPDVEAPDFNAVHLEPVGQQDVTWRKALALFALKKPAAVVEVRGSMPDVEYPGFLVSQLPVTDPEPDADPALDEETEEQYLSRRQRLLALFRLQKAAPGEEQETAEERNWAWFLQQIEEARDRANRPPALCNPRGAVRHVREVVHHNRRWARMAGVPPVGWLRTLVNPVATYKQTFIKMLVLERNNFVRPHVPTGILEVWAPKAAVADQTHKWRGDPTAPALRDRNAFMWLSLPEGGKVDEIVTVDQVMDLDPDDYHMEDIVDRQRRTLDTQTAQGGTLKGQLDVVKEKNAKPLMELLPGGAGLALLFGGPIMLFMFMGG